VVNAVVRSSDSASYLIVDMNLDLGTGEDFVVVDRGTGALFSMINDGASNSFTPVVQNAALEGFLKFQVPAAGVLPIAAVPLDFDGDGDTDIALAYSGSKTVTIYKNQGGGVFVDSAGMASTVSIDLETVPANLVSGNFGPNGELALAYTSRVEKSGIIGLIAIDAATGTLLPVPETTNTAGVVTDLEVFRGLGNDRLLAAEGSKISVSRVSEALEASNGPCTQEPEKEFNLGAPIVALTLSPLGDRVAAITTANEVRIIAMAADATPQQSITSINSASLLGTPTAVYFEPSNGTVSDTVVVGSVLGFVTEPARFVQDPVTEQYLKAASRSLVLLGGGSAQITATDSTSYLFQTQSPTQLGLLRNLTETRFIDLPVNGTAALVKAGSGGNGIVVRGIAGAGGHGGDLIGLSGNADDVRLVAGDGGSSPGGNGGNGGSIANIAQQPGSGQGPGVGASNTIVALNSLILTTGQGGDVTGDDLARKVGLGGAGGSLRNLLLVTKGAAVSLAGGDGGEGGRLGGGVGGAIQSVRLESITEDRNESAFGSQTFSFVSGNGGNSLNGPGGNGGAISGLTTRIDPPDGSPTDSNSTQGDKLQTVLVVGGAVGNGTRGGHGGGLSKVAHTTVFDQRVGGRIVLSDVRMVLSGGVGGAGSVGDGGNGGSVLVMERLQGLTSNLIGATETLLPGLEVRGGRRGRSKTGWRWRSSRSGRRCQ
jgi:hypothetical protein